MDIPEIALSANLGALGYFRWAPSNKPLAMPKPWMLMKPEAELVTKPTVESVFLPLFDR